MNIHIHTCTREHSHTHTHTHTYTYTPGDWAASVEEEESCWDEAEQQRLTRTTPKHTH